jgi:transcriptional regulator with XRE-family HTH domain
VVIHDESRSENADRVELVEAQRELVKAQRTRYLREVMRAKDLTSISDLAKRVGMTPSALTNIQNATRSASAKLIKRIKEQAPGVDGAESLSKGAMANLADSEGAMANLAEPTSKARLTLGQQLAQGYDERRRRLKDRQQDDRTTNDDIRRDFDAMDEDDVFIYISARTPPLEMNEYETELHKAIAKAIQRRAFFLYLTPTAEYLRSVSEHTNYSTLFVEFKDSVLENISDASVKAQCRQRLLLIQTDRNSLFVHPDFKWELFYSNTIDVEYKAAAGALVVCGPGPKDQVKVPISLPPNSTKRMLFEIAETIRLVNPSLPVSGRVPDDIVARLIASAELAMRQKTDPG